VTVARLSPEKDLACLLQAMALVMARDPSIRLEIAGDGPCREELVRLAQELGLGGTVRFLGEVRDVPALLRRASVFILPSRSEGISLTLLEAMAAGVPVIATRVGGNPEVVVDGQTGLLVPAQSPNDLADALLRIRGNNEDAQLLGRAGRRRVESHFDIRTMVAHYERLYAPPPAPAARPAMEVPA
jgi:glycosyltransferase involved in cell wall biosynthesis